VFKIGRTQDIHSRYKSYPKNSILLFYSSCSNAIKIEKKVIDQFVKKYKQRVDIGTEYFEGDYVKMITDIQTIIFNDTILSISERKQIQESIQLRKTKGKCKKDSEDKTIPIEDKTIPIEDKTIPIEDKTIPIENKTIPIEDKTIPIENKTIPIENKTLLDENKIIPVEDKKIPIENKNMIENTTIPVEIIDKTPLLSFVHYIVDDKTYKNNIISLTIYELIRKFNKFTKKYNINEKANHTIPRKLNELHINGITISVRDRTTNKDIYKTEFNKKEIKEYFITYRLL
jgi:hypothetical protein